MSTLEVRHSTANFFFVNIFKMRQVSMKSSKHNNYYDEVEYVKQRLQYIIICKILLQIFTFLKRKHLFYFLRKITMNK